MQDTLIEKRTVMGAMIQLIGNQLIDLDVPNMSWTEVEKLRGEIAATRNQVSQYMNDIENLITGTESVWTKQWELAESLHEPFKKDYNPNDFDAALLQQEFMDAGLEEEFARQLTETILLPTDK